MAAPLGLLAGIGAALGLGSSAISYAGQQKANQTNIRLAKEGREHDVNMWNMQNAYNTPEMQMQRLKEAGLNPNLIYGDGKASTGNADAPKPAHVATTSNEMASFANNNAIQMLSAYQDWQVKKAQIRNIEEETAGKNIQNQLQAHYLPFGEGIATDTAFNTQGKSELTRYQARTLKQQYDEMQKSSADRLGLHSSRLNESKERVSLLQKTIRQRELQNQLDEELKPYGMSTSDALWQRMLAPLFKSTAKGIFDFMDNPGKHFKETFFKK